MIWYKPMFWLFGFGVFYFYFKLPLTSMGVKFGQCWMFLEILGLLVFYVRCKSQ